MLQCGRFLHFGPAHETFYDGQRVLLRVGVQKQNFAAFKRLLVSGTRNTRTHDISAPKHRPDRAAVDDGPFEKWLLWLLLHQKINKPQRRNGTFVVSFEEQNVPSLRISGIQIDSVVAAK